MGAIGEFSDCLALVIDDNEMNRRLAGSMLDLMGVGRVEFASDGQEGLERCLVLRPDMVILDVMMPRLDGYGFLGRFRSTVENDEVPVLVTTALAGLDEKVRIFDAGASDYLPKPLELREFRARVSAHLRTRVLVNRLKRYQDRLSRDLAAAQFMQRALLPSAELLADVERRYGLSISSAFRCSDELGGDLWDVIPIDATRLAVFVADFTGHGLAAAINTFRLQTMLFRSRLLAGQPDALLNRINATLLEVLPRGHFAAMTLAVIDIARQTATAAVAGAPPPIVLGANGRVRVARAKSHPLGLIARPAYATQTVAFRPGDSLTLHSDGVEEAMGGKGAMLGEAGVIERIEALAANPDGHIQSMVDDGWRFDDDVTVVRLRFDGAPVNTETS